MSAAEGVAAKKTVEGIHASSKIKVLLLELCPKLWTFTICIISITDAFCQLSLTKLDAWHDKLDCY